MDECSLTLGFSSHTFNALGETINPDIILDINSNVNTSSADNTCQTLCVGWTHLNYISYIVAVININKTHSDVSPLSFNYHFTLRKPPTEPPKV